MTFNVVFDDFKRRLAAKPDFPLVPVVEQTCTKGTADWDLWWARYNSDDAKWSDLDVSVNIDTTTYTFYKLIPKAETVVSD